MSINTASPTSISKNTINSVSMDIRDFLLNKNLKPVYPNAFNLSPGNQKIGQPVLDTMVNNGSNSIPFGLPLEVEGIFRYDIATIQNKYKDTSSTARSLISVDDITQTKSIDSPNSTFQNGIGQYPNSATDEITKNGLMGKTIEANYRKNNVIKNLYLDTTKQIDVSNFIDYQPLDISQQIKGYIDTYGGLNLGGSGTIQAANIIGSVLNGQGLGLAKGGVVTNFDLRSSLAGRVLGATGLINDTKLGMIAGQQLVLALANNAAFNVEQELLGALNVQENVLSLIKTGNLSAFPRPNYKITVPSSNLGKVGDYTSRILGFTVPRSFLDDSGSIFQNENGDAGNIDRANAMLLNTGQGQLASLIKNITANISVNSTTEFGDVSFRSGYGPGYEDHKGLKLINGNQIYAFGKEGKINGLFKTTGGIPDLSFNREGQVEGSGFNSPNDDYTVPNIKSPTFSWGTSEGGKTNSLADYNDGIFTEKKSLLNKTQKLFNSGGMLNIISTKGSSKNITSQIQTAVYSNMISKGSGVLSANNFDVNGNIITKSDATPENTFCRAWTTFDRYDAVNKLIRNSGLNKTVPYRFNTEGSILDDNGFPKIAPYVTDKPADPKKFMFSIENLAWNDNVTDLLPIEQGPGDLVSGKKGRIMWFPPYNINFTENNTANWEATNFIGRGESVYTYNNTERSGTLSFQMVVDHSSYSNSFKGSNGPVDEYVASFMAGCVLPDSKFSDKLTVSEISKLSTDTDLTNTQKRLLEEQKPPVNFDVFFPNDVSVYDSSYENPGLNDGFTNTNMTNLSTYLNSVCTFCTVTVYGYASVQGISSTHNETLALGRANNVIGILTSSLSITPTRIKLGGSRELTNTGCIKSGDANTPECKNDRKASVEFNYDSNLAAKTSAKPEPVVKKPLQRLNTKITNRFYDETNYFEKLKETDSFVFDKFREKIRYFHPAFHSTTPEGLNSRLSFLNQCVRQGPTLETEGANNLSFGRPPICILRVGDFYNTKIVIDNIGIDYEPLVWDLNPEGVGVQPMIANVNISFKFIGGSTLLGPINKLQNALSFNYYANTQVYDVRADYIAKDPNKDRADNKGNDIVGYSIIDGFNGDMNSSVVTTTSTTAINTPVLDQGQSNLDSTSGTNAQEQPNVEENDLDKITILSTNFNGSSDVPNKLINGIVQLKLNVKSTLTKDYDFIVRIFDKNNTRVDIAVGKILSSDTTKTYNFTINNISFVSDNLIKEYKLEVSFMGGVVKKLYNTISI